LLDLASAFTHPCHFLPISSAKMATVPAPHTGRVYVITGASSGMGLATAQILAAENALGLGLFDISSAALEKIKKELEASGSKTQVLTFVVDVTNTKAVEEATKAVFDKFQRLDGAMNSAGVAPGTGKRIAELEDKEYDFITGVNLGGIKNSMRAQYKYLKAGGSVVNISSVAGVFGQWFASSYVAAKHGVIGLTKVAAKDYGPDGIRCNAILPGPITTPLFMQGVQEGLYTPEALGNLTCLKRCGEPGEIGTFTAFLLSEKASYMTGCAYLVDGGFMA